MRKTYQLSVKETSFFILCAMIFAVCEVLSIALNDYFREISIFDYVFQFNVSVVFFCIGFFIIDLVTELYDNHISGFFIYAKIISLGLFILLGNFAIWAANIPAGDLSKSFAFAPYVFLSSIVASLIGYKLTGSLMQYLKIKFSGKFLFSRYLSSTLPGEIVFSLVFSLLNFYHGRGFTQWLNIFIDLSIVKFVLSTLFSVLIVPITNISRHLLGLAAYGQSTAFVQPFPFKHSFTDETALP